MTGFEFKRWLNDFYLGVDVVPLVMGVINITPDSFYENSRYYSVSRAFEQAMSFVEQGVDIIDIGGESTRPGADVVSLQQELDRVIPVLEKIRQHSNICISLDTYKPEVMQEGIKHEINLINDIKALQTPGALELVALSNVPVCLTHMYGNPQNMMSLVIEGRDIISEVSAFFKKRLQDAKNAGIPSQNLMIDPGIGFGKNLDENIKILNKLREFAEFECPILIGLSRKSFIGQLIGKSAADRKAASLAANVMAYLNGARILRTHDPEETLDALRVSRAIVQA